MFNPSARIANEHALAAASMSPPFCTMTGNKSAAAATTTRAARRRDVSGIRRSGAATASTHVRGRGAWTTSAVDAGEGDTSAIQAPHDF
jgi:hypothetical protein